MAEEKTDYSHIYDFLYRIEKRIGYLEKDAAFIEKRDSKITPRYDRFERSIQSMYNKNEWFGKGPSKHSQKGRNTDIERPSRRITIRRLCYRKRFNKRSIIL